MGREKGDSACGAEVSVHVMGRENGDSACGAGLVCTPQVGEGATARAARGWCAQWGPRVGGGEKARAAFG